MLRTLHAEHEFSDLFVAYAVERHNRTQADLVDQLFNSSEKCLARALVVLSRFGKEDSPEAVTPDVSQETGGNDWHHPIPSEFLHEQVQEDGIYSLQRWAASA
jgi:hypothetical protein